MDGWPCATITYIPTHLRSTTVHEEVSASLLFSLYSAREYILIYIANSNKII